MCCVSSVLGLLLTGYLVQVSAYGSLSPLNLLLFLLIFGAYGVGYVPVDPMYAVF